MKTPIKRIVLIILIVIVGTAGFAAYSEREGLRYLYQQIVVRGKSFALPRSSAEITFKSGGLTLRGSLFLPSEKTSRTAVVLAHGGTRLGRKLSLYRILADKLAQQGHSVLSFDFRGYGESETPTKFDSPSDLDFVEDVKQAVSFLSSVKEAQGADIHLVGHSFGAGVIIPAGIQDSRVRSIVAIAPGRRGKELFWNEDAPRKTYPRERLAQDMEIPAIRNIPLDLINPVLEYVTIDTILEYPEHPPVLLIDGEMEDEQDRRFLENLYNRMTPPKAYVTLDDANHYFGTLRDDDGIYGLTLYWGHLANDVVKTIDTWIKKRS